MKTSSPVVYVCLLALGAATSSVRGDSPVPLIDGLGSHSFKVTTASPEAQRYFDQGLRFVFGFNHGTAIGRSGRQPGSIPIARWPIGASRWPVAPHINFPLVPPPAAEAAWKELGLAQAAAAHATPLERELIGALAQRYANPQPDDRSALDLGYANAMRKVWRACTDNPCNSPHFFWPATP